MVARTSLSVTNSTHVTVDFVAVVVMRTPWLKFEPATS
jgi:hypothetical protein